VTTTAVKDARDYSETEERVIAEVRSLANGMGAIRFEPPLNFSHYAGREYQAEVGLLSRRLTVAGAAADSPPTDPPTRLCPVPAIAAGQFSAGLPCANDSLTGYGGHIMVAGAGSAGRLSSVLLRRMGQTNYLARYPFHMHMLREGGRHSYITGSAIWQSYYRCVSIHGTNSSSVWGNVAHDAIGHCYYFEDGVEENNTVAYNLASLVHPLFGGAGNFLPASGWGSSQDFRDNINVSSTLLLPADATASGYYITNKMNRIIGNAASGGWSGFAFPAFPAPIGLHRAWRGFSPSQRPTQEFRGNSAHSSGYYWTAGAQNLDQPPPLQPSPPLPFASATAAPSLPLRPQRAACTSAASSPTARCPRRGRRSHTTPAAPTATASAPARTASRFLTIRSSSSAIMSRCSIGGCSRKFMASKPTILVRAA